MAHNKVYKVMSEFKRGKLRSGSGRKVASRDQAVAIALSEAGLSRKKMKKKNPHEPFGEKGGRVFSALGKIGIR